MKKEYKNPAMNISLFSEDICTAGASGTSNGIDMVQQAFGSKNVHNSEKASLDTFQFITE